MERELIMITATYKQALKIDVAIGLYSVSRRSGRHIGYQCRYSLHAGREPEVVLYAQQQRAGCRCWEGGMRSLGSTYFRFVSKGPSVFH